MPDLDLGNDARGTSETGVADRGLRSDAEERRAYLLDAYRSALTKLVSDEELAEEDIPALLVMAQGMAGALGERELGPRTRYLYAANLLTIYKHLVRRAAASARDRDGVLLYTDWLGEVRPWSRDRPKRVEDIYTFRPEAVARWNGIVAQGPPPDYQPPGRRRGPPPRRATPVREPARSPGHRRHEAIEPPFGLRAIIHPGGPDARLVYSIIKTPEMTTTTPEGRLAILAAVVARILEPRYEDYAPVAARDLMRAFAGPEERVVYAKEPTEFERLSPGMEFTFDVGRSFLMNLDQVTGGAVPWSLISRLDPHVEVKKDEPKPLWRELFPRATTRERLIWVEERIKKALPLWDPSLGRPKPGSFYPGYSMRYVSDGPFAGDQIWATREYRIYQVNERDAMLEAFRVGVLQASGGVALAYALVGLSMMLIEAPATYTMLRTLMSMRFPMQFAREFVRALTTRPLALLGNIAVDQGADVILSGGWDNYKDSLDKPAGWLSMFFGVLGATKSVLHLPSGVKLRIEGGEFVRVTANPPKAANAASPTPGSETGIAAAKGPKAPVAPAEPAPAAPAPVAPAPAAARDPGAQVVVRADAPNKKPATSPPKTRGKTASEPPAAVGDRPPQKTAKAGERTSDTSASTQQRTASGPQRATDSKATPVRDRTAKESGGRATSDRGTYGGKLDPVEFRFTRQGISYRVTISRSDLAAYNNIPVGNTIVYGVYDYAGRKLIYGVHDARRELIYVGITLKTKKRNPLTRLKEHLATKEGDFIGEAKEFRLIGSYESPREAHALEQDIISEWSPKYNKDLEPWETWIRGPNRKLIARRAGLKVEELDLYLGEPSRLTARGYDLPDVEMSVPKTNLNISFKIEISFEIDIR